MSVTAQRNGRANGRVPAEPEQAATRPRSLDEALLAFQAEAPKLARNADGNVGGRPYKYVDLDALLDTVVPLLTKFDLLWKVKPSTDERGNQLARYTITHVPSGESDGDVVSLPMERQGAQAYGSSLTYLRRYTMQAYLGLAPGDDDDGAAASDRPPTKPPSEQPTASAPKPSERPANAAQVKMLRAKANAAKISPERFANLLLKAADGEPQDWSDEAAAQRWIDRNLERFPARSVTAAKEALEAEAS